MRDINEWVLATLIVLIINLHSFKEHFILYSYEQNK